MLIGLEVELRSPNINIYDLTKREWLRFDKFIMKSWLNVKMSVEYYKRTIEYNFEPQQLTKEYLKKVKLFIEDQMDRYNLSIYGKSPKYVWVHVHIFDLKYRKLKWDEILKTSIGFINDEFDSLWKNSQERLTLSHHLWWNYVHRFYPSFHTHAAQYWRCMAFTWIWANKPKYNPILVSNRSNKWKPRSVEIRLIPNEYLFNDNLYNLLNKIKKWEHTKTNVKLTLRKWLIKLDRWEWYDGG